MYIGFHQEKDARDIGSKRASSAVLHEKQVQWRKDENVISFLKSAVKNLIAASNVQQVNKNTIAGLHQAAIVFF